MFKMFGDDGLEEKLFSLCGLIEIVFFENFSNSQIEKFELKKWSKAEKRIF